MFKYEYTDDTPRDFPTIGLREVKKGDVIESEEPLFSPHLKEVVAKEAPTEKGSEE